jgi:transcription elongation GreA/GreB family factor
MDKESKSKIVALLVEQIQRDLQVLVSSANAAHEAATHSESQAEDKYDTRGLEASYLAAGQARRAGELEELIQSYRYLELRDFAKDSPIAVTALVEVETDSRSSWIFVVPKGGGQNVEVQGQRVQVVSPVSPLGEELIGRRAGEEFELKVAGQKRDYTVSRVV